MTISLIIVCCLVSATLMWLVATGKQINHYLDIPTVAAHDRTPTQAHNTDAGADIRLNEDISIPAGGTYLASTGVSLAIPDGYYAEVHGRSSLAAKHGLTLANNVGIIDQDYRGDILLNLHNTSTRRVTLTAGTRVAQLIFHKQIRPRFHNVNHLPTTERGTGGHGSTGDK